MVVADGFLVVVLDLSRHIWHCYQEEAVAMMRSTKKTVSMQKITGIM